MPRHGEPDKGGELLGLAEIGVGGLGQALAFERHHALIALGLEAAVDGHGEMALRRAATRHRQCKRRDALGEKRA